MATRRKGHVKRVSKRPAQRRRKRSPKRKSSMVWRVYRRIVALFRLAKRAYRRSRKILIGGVKAFKWWWELPRWLKLGKVAAVLVLVLGMPALSAFNEWRVYSNVYKEYYQHFYEEYSQTLINGSVASYYANYYAEFYAKYYSSAAYRASLASALPSATEENLTFPPDSKIAGLHVNDSGLTLIKEFEGLRLEPYADVGGKLTIGYGHLIKPGEYYTRMTENQAHALLQSDVQVAEAYVKRYVKVPLNGNQFAALVSLVYNIGPGNFGKSDLLEYVNEGDMAKAAKEFPRWKRVGKKEVPGLVRRRVAERRLFES